MKIKLPPPHKFLFLAILFAVNMNAFAQLSITLTPSNYNGYNISCFGKQDGSITANVTAGGTAPYSYQWSNDQLTQIITGLAAGYYHVIVIDANGESGEMEITLSEPEILRLEKAVHIYSNGYNVTCHFCADGIVNTQPENGIAPFSYIWSDGGGTQNRNGIVAGSYLVMVTDANGCTAAQDVALTTPDREDWTMIGNANTNTTTSFLGTTDNKDLVFKTNNAERLRVKSSGNIEVSSYIKITNPSTDSLRIVYVDENGLLKVSPLPSPTPCVTPTNHWLTNYCSHPNDAYLISGNVGIGTTLPITRLHVTGNALFTGGNSTITSAPYIKGNNTYTTATTPDYTWYNDLQTGIFHPTTTTGNNHVIAFTNGGTESMRIVKDANGNVIVGIGLDPVAQSPLAAPYKLMVEGKIGARDIVVRNATLAWPDYVFSSSYKPLPLNEIENYISKYNHLPDVPNANEIANRGQEIGTLQILQQQKIEDIYLYLIALEKRVKELEKENALLNK